MSTKLHELLAVESNLENQADKTRKELMSTFDKKRSHFEEKVKVFTPKAETEHPKTEEQSQIQTTVTDELDWVSTFQIQSIDISHQVDLANCMAKADVTDDDGNVILKDVPATSLLQLEKRMKEIQDLITAVPTLDPTKGYKPDESRGKGIFRARDVEVNRTKKVKKALVAYQATEKHPAQVTVYDDDEVIGVVRQSEWCSLITPAKKAELLERVENLSRYIKRARSRANSMEVDVASSKIGKKLMDFILNPLR